MKTHRAPVLFSPRLALVSLILLVGACAANPGDGNANAPQLNVLFVGNSFTYYNNSLHNHVRALAQSAYNGSGTGRMRALTLSGAHLAEHVHGLSSRLEGSKWDWIVLQGHSREAYDGNVQRFHDTVAQLAAVAQQHQAQTALFMTWAYTGEPEMTGVIASNYRLAGRRAGAAVVPVGLAFERAGREAPEITLRVPDRLHPTLEGTYLAACVFFAFLFETPATGLDYTAGLDPSVANQLQTIASETVSNFTTQ